MLAAKMGDSPARGYFDSWNNNPNERISSSSVYNYKNSRQNFKKIFSLKLTKEAAELQGCKEYYLIDLIKKI